MDGKVTGTKVTFITKYDDIIEDGRIDPATHRKAPDTLREVITRYEGEISANSIRFYTGRQRRDEDQ